MVVLSCKKDNGMVSINRALILSGGGARGAYEIGVWKYLCERGWRPNLISGTSVGAINGAAIAAGLSLDDLIRIWSEIDHGNIFRPISLYRRIVNYLLRRGFTAYMDTRPLRSLIESVIDIDKIHKSDIELVISAVNLLSSEICYFGNEAITVDHIMAASAIPLLFPCQYIEGKPYWDAAVMVNTPIQPAVAKSAEEIIVVLLSPVGGINLALPRTPREASERVFEHVMIGSYQALKSSVVEAGELSTRRIATVSPLRMLGLFSILNFSHGQTESLIRRGYEDAKEQLDDFLK
jgi:NTE family protein